MRGARRRAACCAFSSQVLAPRGPLGEAGPFSGGVPTGQRSDQPLPLTLTDAIARGLEHNLGVIARQEDVEQARSERWRALSAVLPNVSGRLSADREVINLAALGFSGFPGIPSVIGPFNVFDARLGVSQPVIDSQGIFHLRETTHELSAAQHNFRNARDLVVVAVTNLYLQALATDSRVVAVRAELETAEALATLADDRRKAGLVPAIDANRAQVQRQNAQQRLITSENAAAKQKLVLARAIGLPLGQPVSLTDPMPYAPGTVPSLDAAVKEAYAHREDLQGQEEALNAARDAERAATAAHLPSLHVDANWGAIGQTPGEAVPTYTVRRLGARAAVQRGRPTRPASIEAAATRGAVARSWKTRARRSTTRCRRRSSTSTPPGGRWIGDANGRRSPMSSSHRRATGS